MRKIILSIALILICGKLQHSTAQAVFIWDEVSDSTFNLWAKNTLPCPVHLKAESDSLEQTYEKYLPQGTQHQLAQLPIDSLHSPTEFKGQIRYHLILGKPNAIHDTTYQYLLPYPQNESYQLIQGNNSNFTHNHPGSMYAFDFDMPENSLVSAARGGTVGFVSVANKDGGDDRNFIQQANKIMICHDDGTVGVYAHLQHNGSFVNIGEQIYAGEIIGLSGNTGYSTTPHLHFVVLAGTESVPVTFKGLTHPLKSGNFYQQNLEAILK